MMTSGGKTTPLIDINDWDFNGKESTTI